MFFNPNNISFRGDMGLDLAADINDEFYEFNMDIFC